MPDTDTGSVILAHAPPLLPSNGTDTILPITDVFRADDGIHTLHPLGNGEHLHVILPPDAGSDTKLVAIVPLNNSGLDRFEAIGRLLASVTGRTIPPDTRLTQQQRARARQMLRAHDATRSGATQQDIAEVILRVKKLNRDEWQAASERHVIARLVRDARAMIAHGYRKLLRHRRPK